ncbi:MAG: phosphoadenylyl-sulfate reductase [Gammaproteobacteria bacterium]|nr:phosphoadenylyl-sulfate reductase [Gammaproteobacteria bacterium]
MFDRSAPQPEPEIQAVNGTESRACQIDRGSFTDDAHLANWNRRLAALEAPDRVRCVLDNLPGVAVLTSSFGAQAAVSLHMLTQQKPDIPVILLDTGYLFPETYRFIDELSERLSLNLKVYRNEMSPARQEALYGQRWKQGLEGIEQYNYANKVEPMGRALEELNVGTWFTGLRRVQSQSRAEVPFVQLLGGRFKVAPIADWTDRDVYEYLTHHELPYHPLWSEGYVSIGDVHTTISLHEAGSEEQTRFLGLKRECGLHEATYGSGASVRA